ncbi:unnamed protein product [Medioppia subpectinata]|uniref:Legumain n=1 Tax=Medioppia subpectinata TaxID=1979941 RepID=A0A7R9Q467_9ACAR|nr:unnamed protein product [Medioppia subpectinata]CAG2112267.1 unnamed protein product [Medioppia subpectinata]
MKWADVYHAYQVIKAHGIPDENIVVMHYDDIAQHPNNPDKGIVVNRVGGPDVYKGVPKHYIGKEVTPQNFLKVLQGDATLKAQGKKVIESGPNDRVFVYLDDHGADEIVAFPNGDLLHAKDLNQAFKDMNTKKQFNHLVFYLAACEAGSMFAKLLPNDINVYAVSATKPDELGWKANSEWKKYNTWLAVYFAVTWLENSETADLTKESVETQFQYIKERNNFTMDGELHWQHAQEYGDLTIANKAHVSEYMGDKKVQFDAATVAPTGFSLSRDAAINIVRKQIETTDDFAAKQQ